MSQLINPNDVPTPPLWFVIVWALFGLAYSFINVLPMVLMWLKAEKMIQRLKEKKPYHLPLLHRGSTIERVGEMKLIYRRTSNPVCNLRVIFNAGSCVETPARYGTAHFLEHLFFQATENHTAKQLNQLRGRLGDFNAYTSHEQTVYHANFMSEDFNRASGLLAEMILRPSLNPDDVEKEKYVITEELRTRAAHPVTFAFEKMISDAVGPTAHQVAGTEESVSFMTAEVLSEFRKTHYKSDRMAISCAGEVDVHRVREFAAAMEAALPRSEQPISDMRPLSMASWKMNQVDFACHHPTKQAVLLMVWPGMSLQAQCESNDAADLMASALGGGAYSLLYQRLREELSLCYSTWANSWDHRLGGVFYVGVMLDEVSIPKAIEEITAIVKRTWSAGALGESFETAKASHMLDVCRVFETAGGYARIGDFAFHLTDSAIEAYTDPVGRREATRQMRLGDVEQMAHRIFAGVTPKIVTMTHAKEAE